MAADYSIRLIAKNEGLEYQSATGAYHFDVQLEGRTWTLHLPGSRGAQFEPHELSAAEEQEIVPRLVEFLSRIYWFGLFPRRYDVRVVRAPVHG